MLSPFRQFQRWVAVVGSVAHLAAKDPGGPPGDVSRPRRSRQPPPAGRAGSRIPGAFAGGSSERTVQLWGWPSPARSAHRRLVTPTSSFRWVAPAGPSSQAAGIVRAVVARGHSLSSCCPGSADLRTGPAGSSLLSQTTQICFRAPRPPHASQTVSQSMRQPAIIWGHPRPCLRPPLHCQACQRSLTRKRSLVQIQNRPPASPLAQGHSAP